jgi:transglutaminase-like putative cysteine protease
MSTAAWPADGSVRRQTVGNERRLPVPAARVPTFLLLAGFGAFTWGRMVGPAAGGAMTAMLWAALAAAGVLIVVARRRPGRWPRAAITLLVAAALLLVALVAAGVPGHFLRPRAWDELAGGIGQGLGTVPNVRVPYQGVDEWTRTVIVLGGAALVALSALLAFAPRRAGAFGSPFAAAIPLATLYLVPVMQRDGAHQFWGGAAFTLLLVAFLWLERVERRTAPMAAGIVAAAIIAGLVLGPGLDRGTALLDYEGLAQSLSAGASQRFDWNHDYAPLDARTGREVLRVQASHRAYWKAADLAEFDGKRWLQGDETRGTDLDGALPRAHEEWVQRLRVTFRSLTSSQFVAAGRTVLINHSPREPVPSGPGMFVTAGRPLKHGNAYRALVYTPRPANAELSAASRLPLPLETVGTGLTSISLPAERGSIGPTQRVVIPPWGQGEPTPDALAAIAASPYKRVYELATRLRARSRTPYEYMVAVERHLANGFAYSEDPKRSDIPLVAFLFGEKAGYCQQFSGAMALLLRLGGVPARVAAGFAPGSLDRDRHEYVVRDIDAHSWVEVYFPGIGWVTRDPTPADAPARSQTSDVASTGPGLATPLRDALPNTAQRRDPGAAIGPGGAAAQQRGSGVPVAAIALGVMGVLGAIAGLLVVRRRRRAPAAPDDHGAGALAELLRALRRSGRPPSPQTTLETLAARYRGTAAEGYVRALTAARYGYGEGRPTPAQRAALRRELGAGSGVRGRARAWWALPPRLARTRR